MKCFLLSAALILFGTVQTSMAQQRKPIVKKRASRPSTTQVQKKQEQPATRTTALYDVYAKWVAVSDKYIYYIQNSNNNAVMGINRKTGIQEIIIPGIENVYENVRPKLKRIVYSGDKLFLVTETKHLKEEFYIFDGRSFETSKRCNNWSEILRASNNHIVVTTQNGECQVWNTVEMKLVVSFNRDSPEPIYFGGSFMEPSTVASDGSLWYSYSHEPGVIQVKPNGKIIFYSLAQEPYLQKNEVHGIKVKAKDNYIYVSCSRRIYRMNMLNPGVWEEYAKIPATEEHSFSWFCPDSQGNLLIQGFSSKNYNTEFYKIGSFETPFPLGKELRTGLKEFYREITLDLVYSEGVVCDANDNFIILKYNRIYIYNPNNIIGYTAAVGKIIKTIN